jgi:hypothetical protein
VDVPVAAASHAIAARQWVVRVVTGGVTFWLAYENGSYAEPTRHAISIAVWWGVIVALVAGMAKTKRALTGTVAVGLSLAAFAAWTLASVIWASDPESAFSEFDRVSLYLGVFVLCSALFRRRDLAAWCDGIGFGIGAIGVLALFSRAFPDAVGRPAASTILPALTSRLSYPLGYWNGLGIFCALGLPLLYACMTSERPRALRAAAAGVVPLLAATIYLTSSRGAVATALVAVVVFVLLTPRRWSALGALAVTGVASAVSVAIVERHPDLANGVSGSSTVAVVLFVIAVAASAIFAGLLFVPPPRKRPSPAVGWGVAAAIGIVVLLVVAAAHPVRRFNEFKQPPGGLTAAQGDYVKSHLLSGTGSGRWQFWRAALDEFDTSRIHGRGAGSFADWWAAHGSLATSIQDAHSLYLETLGELGVVGLVLLLLPLAFAASVIATWLRRLETEAQIGVAAATSLLCGYLVAAGIDWMWELTAVSVVAFAMLAVAVAACAPDAGPVTATNGRRPFVALGVATLVAAWLAICAAALPLLTHLQIGASQAASRDGRTLDALQAARSAIRLQPWAAQPYLQLALVSEQAGRLDVAGTAIRRAIARSPDDWHLWLVATRIQTKQGHIAAAQRSLRRARALNPRSPLFYGFGQAS